MHDPLSLAFDVKMPLPWKRKSQWMKESKWASFTLAEIWHHDPEKDGSDDSCGWFIRARHCDPAALERITKAFERDWDGVFEWNEKSDGFEEGDTPSVTFRGYFSPSGDPVMSCHGIALNLFFTAAMEVFGNRDKAMKWLQSHLFEILIFAENPVDSMRDTIEGSFRNGKVRSKHERKDWIASLASMVYAWIIRDSRPWYKHPKWHIHHWKITFPWYRTIRRWLLNRCCKCGGRFRFGECPCTDQWNAPEPKWFRGETHLYCQKCSGMSGTAKHGDLTA